MEKLKEVSAKRSSSITDPQKKLLVEFVKQHEDLNTGNFASISKKEARVLWQEITTTLNCIPGGAEKEWSQWRKAWQDLKKNTKAKQVKIKKYRAKTGGGGPPKDVITAIDQEIATMIKPVLTEGHPEVEESVVMFNFDVELPQVDLQMHLDVDTPSQVLLQRQGTVATAATTSNVNDSLDFLQPQATMTSITNQETETAVMLESTHPGSSSLGPSKAAKSLPQAAQRFTKSMRLQKSLGLSKELVEVNKKKAADDSSYHAQKLKLMADDMAARRNFEEQVLTILKTNAAFQAEILKCLVKKN